MDLVRSGAKLAFAAVDFFLPSLKGPRILIYHQVGSNLGRQMEVTIADFEWQLDWLAAHREVVALESALRRWEDEGSDDLVVITFDDGYHDVYTNAFPLLEERRMPFTLYLTTDPVETGTTAGEDSGAIPLRWDDIGEMLETGLVTVGAHTHHHVDVRHMFRADIEQDLEACDRLIESRLGLRPLHFAYPWGYWSSQADSAVRDRYSSAVLGAHTLRRPPRVDPYLIHRFPVQLSDGRTWFGARLRGGLVMEEQLRRRLRGYEGP